MGDETYTGMIKGMEKKVKEEPKIEELEKPKLKKKVNKEEDING